MPKKLYPSEPAVTFDAVLDEFRQFLRELPEPEDFEIHTSDPAPEQFAGALIDEHYPPQHQLPLDD